MPVNPLDGLQPTPIVPDRAQSGGGRRAGEDAPTDRPADTTGAAGTNLRVLADALGVDPEELLAHLGAAATGDGAPSTTPSATDQEAAAPPSAADNTPSATSSPAANAAAALLNRGTAANAWTTDLTQHRGGLLVDITV